MCHCAPLCHCSLPYAKLPNNFSLFALNLHCLPNYAYAMLTPVGPCLTCLTVLHAAQTAVRTTCLYAHTFSLIASNTHCLSNCAYATLAPLGTDLTRLGTDLAYLPNPLAITIMHELRMKFITSWCLRQVNCGFIYSTASETFINRSCAQARTDR